MPRPRILPLLVAGLVATAVLGTALAPPALGGYKLRRDGPLSQSSDGVVPYASSHLDATASELIVPTGHGAYEHPRAVSEILRILNQAASR